MRLPAKMSVPVTVCILPVVHDDRDHPDHREDDVRMTARAFR